MSIGYIQHTIALLIDANSASFSYWHINSRTINLVTLV